MASDVESAIDADRFENVIGKKHEVFYRYGYKYTTFELAIMHYQGCIEKMEDWIEKNITSDEFEALDIATQYTNYLRIFLCQVKAEKIVLSGSILALIIWCRKNTR